MRKEKKKQILYIKDQKENAAATNAATRFSARSSQQLSLRVLHSKKWAVCVHSRFAYYALIHTHAHINAAQQALIKVTVPRDLCRNGATFH